jgi:outer membrane protein assembly factor BamB
MLRILRLTAFIGAVSFLGTGCTWLSVGHDAGRTGWSPLAGGLDAATVDELEVTWTATVPGAAGESVSDGRRVYVRSLETVSAFDLADGAGRWSTALLWGVAGPVIIGNQVQVPIVGAQCRLRSLDSATGEEIATADFIKPALGAPGGFSACGVNDALAVGPKAFASWYYVASGLSPGCPEFSTFAAGPGIEGIGSPDRWTTDTDMDSGCGSGPVPGDEPPPYSAPSARSTTVVVGFDSLIRAFPTEACWFCPSAWTHDLGATTVVGAPTFLDNGDVAVATAAGNVVVVNGATGALKWSGAVGSPLAQPLAATSKTIFATAANGAIAAFPLTGCGQPTCVPQWSAKLASPASARPSVGNDVLYVGSENGAVTAFPAEGCGAATCAALWSRTTGSKVTGAPIIVAGRVVVGSESGTVTAFERSTG